jgi:hypothetical protein
MNDRVFRVTLFDSHHNCIQNKIPMNRRSSGPTYDLSRKPIHDDGQVEPSFPSPDVCNIWHPNAIRLRYYLEWWGVEGGVITPVMYTIIQSISTFGGYIGAILADNGHAITRIFHAGKLRRSMH